MMKFIYDSLDTVKTLKHPTRKDYIQLTIAIFGLVIFSAAFFIFVDTIATDLYSMLYETLV